MNANLGQKYRHKGRGSVYTVTGFATLQAATDLDGVLLVVYRHDVSGRWWARPVTEFEDGRFEPEVGR